MGFYQWWEMGICGGLLMVGSREFEMWDSMVVRGVVLEGLRD